MIWKITGVAGAVVRQSKSLDSDVVCTLSTSTVLESVQQDGKRIKITYPVEGWVSIRNQQDYPICEQVHHYTKVKDNGNVKCILIRDEPQEMPISKRKRKSSKNKRSPQKMMSRMPFASSRNSNNVRTSPTFRPVNKGQRISPLNIATMTSPKKADS